MPLLAALELGLCEDIPGFAPCKHEMVRLSISVNWTSASLTVIEVSRAWNVEMARWYDLRFCIIRGTMPFIFANARASQANISPFKEIINHKRIVLLHRSSSLLHL